MNIKSTSSLNRAISAYSSTPPKADVGPKTKATNSMPVALSVGSQSLTGVDKDIDMAKVQAIRDSLANGTLKINPERIAQGLLDQAAELFNR